MRNFSIILLSLFSFKAFSQVNDNKIYSFLTLPNSPKQSALGGDNVTISSNDANQVFYNPAALNSSMDGQFNINYGSIYGDLHVGSANFTKTFSSNRTLQFGVVYMNYGDFDGYDELGQATTQFSGNDIAAYLSYSYQIENSDFYIGSNIKFISSTLESYSSYAVAADIGALYKKEETGWTAGLSIRNIGTQLKSYEEVDEKLPFNITAGVSKQLENVPIRWHLTLENLQKWEIGFVNPNRGQEGLDGVKTEENIGFIDHALRHVIIGAELFTNKSFNVNLSYNFRRGEELSYLNNKSFAGFSGGFAIKLNKLKFEYSYSRMNLAGNTNVLGLSIKL